MNIFKQYEVIPLTLIELAGNYQIWALDLLTNPGLLLNSYIIALVVFSQDKLVGLL